MGYTVSCFFVCYTHGFVLRGAGYEDAKMLDCNIFEVCSGIGWIAVWAFILTNSG